jgi:hypothetical protein
MFERPWQKRNARRPIFVTLFGMVTFVRLEQAEKAFAPIEITLFGMVTLESPLHPEKAQSSICVTLFGMTYSPSNPSGYLISFLFDVSNSTPFSEL